jgi:5-methylcytosine-specific restriction protein A
MTKKPSTRWSDMELEAAVDAYLSMLQKERMSEPFNKAEINRNLREGALSARGKSSVEMRMHNLSSIFLAMGLRRVEGYVPRDNAGTNIRSKIQAILERKGVSTSTSYVASTDVKSLNQKTEESSTDFLSSPPPGNKDPKSATSTTTTYERDLKVRDWVLKNAKGKCEGCGQNAPFLLTDGAPCLEVHHVRRLADNGSDRTTNAVALCPNCHRRCHLSADGEMFTASLYERLNRLIIEDPDVSK